MGAQDLRPGGRARMVVRFLERGGRDHHLLARAASLARAEARQRHGKALIAAGFAVSCAGILAYCVVCLSGGLNVELGDILLRNVVPLARLTLAVIGAGTAAWLAGSFMFLAGALEADAEESPGLGPPRGHEER